MSIMHPTIKNGFNVPPFLVRIVKCLEINHTKRRATSFVCKSSASLSINHIVLFTRDSHSAIAYIDNAAGILRIIDV